MTGNQQILGPSAMARLAFWARNITLVSSPQVSWPGFSYTAGEWARLSGLAKNVGEGPFARFMTITAVAFIALAAIAMVGIFLPLATWLFPVPADTPALQFVLLLAATALLVIGLGLPASMRLASAMSADVAMRELVPASEDAALARKVAFQINRITVIMCGLFVPGTLLWIGFNIEAGPIITALKWLSFAAIGVSAVYARKGQPK
ncbi:MAG: hypothetical protein JO163_12690 [Methylobacteriaceae bacterium]|nr:hypothetical protein [Methylobacteriaceae bacterium]